MMCAGIIAASAVLAANASLDAQQAGRRGSAWRDIQGFNIVLVVGERQRGTSSTEDLPGGAKRALNDMREFLPYKHYRVLDSQWTSCCSPELVRLSMPLAGRLQGVTAGTGSASATVLLPRVYAFSLSVSETNEADGIPVRFALRLDEGASGRGSQAASSDRTRENRAADIRAEIETLREQIQTLQGRIEVGVAPPQDLRPLRDRYAQLERRLSETVHAMSGQGGASGSRAIIDSSFTMKVGETVVVGTSRLGGDKALIALVTAVRRTTSGR
jgi:hypothetical protein